MNDSMSTMVLVGLSQSEWDSVIDLIATCEIDEGQKLDITIKKLINQIY